MVKSLATATRKFKERLTPPRAALTWGIPLPAVSGAQRSTKKPVRKPPNKPTVGSKIKAGISVDVATRQLPSHPTPNLSKTPANPDTKPIRQASKIARRFGFKKN